ncbi:MAG: class I SAM-dependent methyltransferase, partial [Gammaproteobacteria bacterium]|nr:class I SAM-dependent methyltransferase [Gammaproteobacteria bacterium]
KTQTGQLLEDYEQQILDEILPDLFGYHLLYLGHPDKFKTTSASRVSNQVLVNICTPGYYSYNPDISMLPNPCFEADAHRLPVTADSIDVVVLPHLLEFSCYPHEVLREAERVLIPEGHVVIMGFNPFSIWSLWRLALGWRSRIPWCGAFRSTTRIKDWLALLGFDISTTHYYFFRPPLQNKGILQKLGFLEHVGQRIWPIFGAGYIIVARKRTVTLTPIKPRWKSRQTIVAAGLAEPMSPHQKKDSVVK